MDKDMKDKLEMKAQMKSADVAKYLMGLADGFKAGRIVVEQGADSLVLLPAVLAEVEVEARVKKDKARFSLEVSWRTACEEDCEELKISAGKPEKKDEPKKAEEKKVEEKKPAPAPVAKPAAPALKVETAPAKPMMAKPVAKPEVKPEVKAVAPKAPEAKPEAAKPAAAPAATGQTKP